jgi:hypothetical protein
MAISSNERSLWLLKEACFNDGALQQHQNEGIFIKSL